MLDLFTPVAPGYGVRSPQDLMDLVWDPFLEVDQKLLLMMDKKNILKNMKNNMILKDVITIHHLFALNVEKNFKLLVIDTRK